MKDWDASKSQSRCPNQDSFLSWPPQLPQARRGQHLYRRPQHEAALCKMRAHCPTTSLILLLLCYAPLPIHSHGVQSPQRCSIFFPDLAVQTIIFPSVPWWDLASLLHTGMQSITLTTQCPVCFATTFWAILPLLLARQCAGVLCRDAEMLLKSTCDISIQSLPHLAQGNFSAIRCMDQTGQGRKVLTLWGVTAALSAGPIRLLEKPVETHLKFKPSYRVCPVFSSFLTLKGILFFPVEEDV